MFRIWKFTRSKQNPILRRYQITLSAVLNGGVTLNEQSKAEAVKENIEIYAQKQFILSILWIKGQDARKGGLKIRKLNQQVNFFQRTRNAG